MAEAVALLVAVDRPDIGILVDTLHFNRVPSTLDVLAAPCHCGAFPSYPLRCNGGAVLDTRRTIARHPGRAPIPVEITLYPLLAAMPAGIPVALGISMPVLTARVGNKAVVLRVCQDATRLATVEINGSMPA